jgi:hypothetical protein
VAGLAVFALDDGTQIHFDSSDGSADYPGDGEVVTRGLRRSDVTERATQTFDEVTRSLVGPMRAILDSLRQAAEGVDEVELSFGVRFSVSAGAVISQVGGEANLTVTMHWRREQS